jgi:L-alanine-DL-glutamate epimerase-like enolase superfamily enzyme
MHPYPAVLPRRSFLKSLAGVPALAVLRARALEAKLPAAKITRVRIYEPPDLNPLFNQSNMLCTVETDIGLAGIGEGGAKDTLEQCAGTLIGKDPFRSAAIWQEMFIAWFYPPGREKTHALGAMDLALWDLKGKALGVPVHDILGGTTRNFCECYATSGAPGPAGQRGSLGDRARAALDAGYRAFRMGAADVPVGGVFDPRHMVDTVVAQAREVREAIGPKGDWCIDFHQRFAYDDALRACRGIEPFAPMFVEDPVRDEHVLQDLPRLRDQTDVPLTAGEEWGDRWDFAPLVEHHDLDYIRATLPNVGGITEMMKVAAICETHDVGIIPHFTGPVATAALVNCLSTFSGPVLMEYNYGGRPIPYLPEGLDFRDGKAYANDRPGLGVTLDLTRLKQVAEVTVPGRRDVFERPDGSIGHW